MKYAIVSDIHANLQAWQATSADIVAHGVDAVICLGDVVGYGPRPAETLSAAYPKFDNYIIGNHEAAICGRFDVTQFADDAQNMIEWTKKYLGDKAIDLFRGLPLTVDLSSAAVSAVGTHGTMFEPEEFDYVIDEDEAWQCWAACEQQVIFVGHTHEPMLHVLAPDERYKVFDPTPFVIEEDFRYIVNVGSVGMPRSKDFRACYCLYDTDTATVSWQLTAYDFDAFKRDVTERIGHSAQAQELLAIFDSKQGGSDKRETIDFSSSRPVPQAKMEARRKKNVSVRKTIRSVPTSVSKSKESEVKTVEKKKKPTATGKKPVMVKGIVALLVVIGVIAGVIYSKRSSGPASVSAPPVSSAAAAAAAKAATEAGRIKELEKELKDAEDFWTDNPDRSMAASVMFMELAEKAKGTPVEALAKKRLAEVNSSGALGQTSESVPEVAEPDASGVIVLQPNAAKFEGSTVGYVKEKDCIGKWTNMDDKVSWSIVTEKREYEVLLNYFQQQKGYSIEIHVKDKILKFPIPPSKSSTQPITSSAGRVRLEKGQGDLRIIPANKTQKGYLISLRSVILKPVK